LSGLHCAIVHVPAWMVILPPTSEMPVPSATVS
jgi:hypothetical protein